MVCAMQYGAGKGDKGSRSNPVVIDVEGKGSMFTSNPLYYQHTDQTQQFEKVGTNMADVGCSGAYKLPRPSMVVRLLM